MNIEASQTELNPEIKPSLLKRQMFTGRLNRANYALGYFGIVLLVIIFILVMTNFPDNRTYAQIQKDATDTPHTILTFFIALPIPVFILIAFTSLTTRRMHDLDKEILWREWPNWFYDLLLKKGAEGPNQYGDPQKGIGIRQILGIK